MSIVNFIPQNLEDCKKMKIHCAKKFKVSCSHLIKILPYCMKLNHLSILICEERVPHTDIRKNFFNKAAIEVFEKMAATLPFDFIKVL